MKYGNELVKSVTDAFLSGRSSLRVWNGPWEFPGRPSAAGQGGWKPGFPPGSSGQPGG